MRSGLWRRPPQRVVEPQPCPHRQPQPRGLPLRPHWPDPPSSAQPLAWNRRLPHYSLPACLPRSPQPLASDPRSSMPLRGPRREIERLRTISRPWLRPQSQEPLTRIRRVPARTPATRCNSVLPADFRSEDYPCSCSAFFFAAKTSPLPTPRYAERDPFKRRAPSPSRWRPSIT